MGCIRCFVPLVKGKIPLTGEMSRSDRGILNIYRIALPKLKSHKMQSSLQISLICTNLNKFTICS